jgi:hypothetical protein
MNERTNERTYEKAAAKAQRTQKMSWPATNLLPLNQHALLLLSLKVVTHRIMYQLHTLSLGMGLLIGIYMTHRKIRAHRCLDQRPSIRRQPNPTTGGFLCQEPFDLIHLTMHFSVV